MPIFHNVEGIWKKAAAPPKIFDAAIDDWATVRAVYVHSQGEWREIWPGEVSITPILTVAASDVIWPANANATVTILRPFGKTIPIRRTVSVSSGSWSQSFYAIEEQKTYQLPAMDVGEYVVEASWSGDFQKGFDTYNVWKAVPIVVLTVDPSTINAGQRTNLTVSVFVNGEPAPAGGYFDVRWQTKTGGPFGLWSDEALNLEVYYEGHPVTFSVAPAVTVAWQARLRDHHNLVDTESEIVNTYVRHKQTGYLDVTPTAIRSYCDGGQKLRRSKYDIFHGEEMENQVPSPYGEQFGMIWLPPLSSDKMCTAVEVVWYPEHTAIDTNIDGNQGTAHMKVGVHRVATPPDNIDIVKNPDVLPSLIDVYMSKDTPEEIEELSRFLVHLVNDHRNGGFGITVGDNASVDGTWYGYGRFSRIRYIWEKWV